MSQETDDYILVVIWITVWIHEVLRDFFITAQIHNIRCVGKGMHSLSAFV